VEGVHHFIYYRSVSLLSTTYKISSIILLSRLTPYAEVVIGDHQCRFLHKRSTTDRTGRRTKCHTIDCARNTFLLLQKHLASVTELILIGWKIVPNEEHVQCDHRFASQPIANEPLHSSQLFDTSLQKARGTTSLCGS